MSDTESGAKWRVIEGAIMTSCRLKVGDDGDYQILYIIGFKTSKQIYILNVKYIFENEANIPYFLHQFRFCVPK